MPRYRYTILLGVKGGEPVGHSERWDFDMASDTDAASFATLLASRRSQFLPFGWKVVSVRVGSLTPFHRTSGTWRWKQKGIHLCIPPTPSGGGNTAEVTGGAVYYRFNYMPGSGRPAIRLFTPIPTPWFNGSSTGPNGIQTQADGEIQPWANWLKSHNHRLYTIDKTTGTPTDSTLSCVTFQRSAVKKVGRPFFLRRGRRFAHRTSH